MKKDITRYRKNQKALYNMRHNIEMALSKFTAIMVGQPNEYKTSKGEINYYPSDVLYYWRCYTIDIKGQIINEPTKVPEEVFGVICEGVWHMGDTPRKITIMFNDL